MSRKCPARKRPPAGWRLSAGRPVVRSPLALIRKNLARAAWSFGLAAVMATPALADSPVFRNIEIGGGFNVETITVEQEDGMWTRITDHPRTIPIYMNIEMSRGYIEFYRIGRALTDGAVRGIFSTYFLGSSASVGIPIETRIDSRTSVAGPMNIFIGENTRLNASDEQAIVNQCNSKWTETESGHSFSYALPLAIHADARRHRRKRFPLVYGDEYAGFGDFGRAATTGFVTLNVECLGNSKPAKDAPSTSKPPSPSDGVPRTSGLDTPKTPGTQDLGFDHGAMKVNDIRLTLTTYSNAFTEPNPGTKCKKAKLAVTLETNQEGPVSFKLWKQRGDGQIGSEVVNATAHHDEGHFYAVHERWVEVDETTNVQFNARDLVNETFYNETGWKDITLHCTGAGGGGLVNPTDDDDGVAHTAFEGNFHFIDNGPAAQNNTCPRNAKALVWFDAPKQDNIHYSLDCGALGNFSGVLQPEKIGSGHYRAGKLITFEVTDTIEAGCTLRTVSPGDARDHAFAAHVFQCAKTAGFGSEIGGLTVEEPTPDNGIPTPAPKPKVNPAVGAAVGGLKAEPKPTHTPTVPAKKTAPIRVNPEPPAPKLVCNGGKISKGACACGPNKLRKKIGAAAYQCVAVAKPPEKKKPLRVSPPPKKKVKLVCKGGKVANGKCLCGASAKRVKLGQNAFACQKKQAVRANPTPKKKAVQPKRVSPQTKKQSLVCKGGTARGGKCLCGKKKTAKKLGPKRFACVPKRS